MKNKKVVVSYGRTVPTSVLYSNIRIYSSVEFELEEGEDLKTIRNKEFLELKKFIDRKINETNF